MKVVYLRLYNKYYKEGIRKMFTVSWTVKLLVFILLHFINVGEKLRLEDKECMPFRPDMETMMFFGLTV